MKKWEVVLLFMGTTRTITITEIFAMTSDEAVGHALSHLSMPSTWQVHHVAEVVTV